MGTPTSSAVVATASALATDDSGSVTYEVSYNNGSTWATIVPSGANFTLAGSAGVTYATTKLRAKDAAGNTSTPVLSVPSYTMAASADVTAPTVGTMAASSITSSGFTLTVSGASDAVGLHAQPYAFTTDGGTTWSAYQASAALTVTGKTASTGYSCNWRVRDAAGNVSTGTAQTVTTGAAGPLSRSYVGHVDDNTALSSYAFTSASIGTPAADRSVVLAIFIRSTTSQTITGVTIGGAAATIDSQQTITTGTTFSIVGFARLTVASGATADVAITASGAVAGCRVNVWTIGGGTPAFVAAQYNYQSLNLEPLSLSLTTAADGCALGVALAADDLADFAWLGLTEDADYAPTTSSRIGAASALTTGAALTITAQDNISGVVSGAAISYGPAA